MLNGMIYSWVHTPAPTETEQLRILLCFWQQLTLFFFFCYDVRDGNG